jgi:nitrate/nitrite transport system ATP-binding protein
MDTCLELSQLGKAYDTPQGPAVIVKDINLRIHAGEFVCIIGHSGCGKSTILSIVMGLNEATVGAVILDGKEVTGPGTDRGVVFQAAVLLPWLTARENVLLAVAQVNGHHRSAERRQLAERYLAQVGLEAEADVYPHELSAGMRQRVGIARAFALEPKVLLLDEPLSLLDALTRMELQDELIRLWEKDRKTVLMVTHDVDEALLLADRIVMMTSGPAATIGEILTVPFPRPRARIDVLSHPDYYRLRDHLITFLEERAYQTPLAPTPSAERAPSSYTPGERPQHRPSVGLTEEERFIIEKYTGFNRFRRKYRNGFPGS